MPRLIVIEGADAGKEFDVTDDRLTVGRESACGVRLFDTEVSRRHAELRRDPDGRYRLVDLGSANGVYVNDRPIADVLLGNGDRVRVGRTVMVLHGSPEPPASDLAERIRLIARPTGEFPSAIVGRIAAGDGNRLLTSPDPQSPWLRQRLGILYEACAAVTHVHDLEQLSAVVLDLAFRAIEADRGGVVLLDDDGTARPQAVRWRDPTAGRDPVGVSRTVVEYVLQTQDGVLVADAAADDRFATGQSVIRQGIREVIGVPLKGRREPLGVLYLDAFRLKSEEPLPPRFTPDHLALAAALAHLAALAIESTRYYQAMVQAERLAAVGQTVAALSHHIKNILQGLRGGSDVLKTGLNDHDDALIEAGWRLVEKNQRRIYDLVMDMLSFSKEREPAWEPTDLNRLADDVAELVRPRAVERGVELVVVPHPDGPVISADPEGLHRALLNLAANALDAVEAADAPRVEIAVEADGPPTPWRIAVRDTGPGLAPEIVGTLFRPFASTKGSRGTGLGLAVSRKIVREHGGDVTAANRPGGGAEFLMRLPVAEPPHSG